MPASGVLELPRGFAPRNDLLNTLQDFIRRCSLKMNPVRLTLRNFLCYRENVPALDFTGLHVVCLSGANGHGKSALLDSITWCLWGKARGKTHDELVSYGADEMRVELEFLARDTLYRAIRSHLRGGGRRRQGVTDLQLQIGTSGPGGPEWQSITANTVQETRAKIEQLLGLDYDTFINSAFLVQGRADEFTNKTATGRKEVLGKVLGLSAYDQLQEQARSRLGECRESAATVRGSVENMEQRLAELGDPSQELLGVGLRLEALEKQGQSQADEAELARARVEELRRRRDEQTAIQKRLQATRHDLEDLRASRAITSQRIDGYQKIILQADAIQQGAAQLHDVRRQFQALEQSRSQFEALRGQRDGLERVIGERRIRLEESERQLGKRARDLSSQAQGAAGLTEQLETARRQAADLDSQEQDLAARRELQQKLASSIEKASSDAERYKMEGQELAAKLKLLEGTAHQGAVCPLCQTTLGADGCHRLAEAYQRDIEDKRRMYRENQSSLKNLDEEKKRLYAALTQQEQVTAQNRRDSQRRVSTLERQLEEARLAQEELAPVQEKLAQAQAMLESGEFAAPEIQQRAGLDRQINALGYSEESRQLSYLQMQKLQPFEDQLRRLEQAQAALPQEQETLARTQDMLARRQEELSAQETRFSQGESALKELPQWEARLRQAETALKATQESQQAALTRQGVLKRDLERLDQLRQEMAEAKARKQALEDDQAVYQELATAFGRQGVQAMLIETVVPQLEEETNLLLGRMTDNRMSLQLETQRERRSSGRAGREDPIETLEIKVSDELGPRAYEMFSGGEAFRVNLALRIALSQVLARRMGAPLATLFIDEGFGTQDAAGRERIVDMINAIKDDFDKIVVITHLEDLKDEFPDRIEVWKEASGSTFRLS
ncbi:MAG: SMC family ATPase [SAR202 cluster bacterium]|nr:SMC family ATPase [SAR202 cluster bacterium]